MENNKTSRYLIENDFSFQGFRCVVTGVSTGHRCGYIAIPKDHPLHGIPHDQLNGLDVYGGWTYGDLQTSFPVTTDTPTWWIGFDCGHSGESCDFQLMEELGEAKLVSTMRKGMGFEAGSVNSIDFVISELKSAVKQLSKLG
jgi:hypothetical protein